MGKRSPGPMSYIREASALRNIKLCYAGRSFSIRVVIRCLLLFGAYSQQISFYTTPRGYDEAGKHSINCFQRRQS